ncbi:MAG: alpha/beta hydrolase [Kiritimatiellae bacterium]|nr:alpha/beta hydrolase [Kiritimatiellia bacterium]
MSSDRFEAATQAVLGTRSFGVQCSVSSPLHEPGSRGRSPSICTSCSANWRASVLASRCLERTPCSFVNRLLIIALVGVVAQTAVARHAFRRGEELPAGVQSKKNIFYTERGHKKFQALDLYWTEPRGEKPALVWIHGGGWTTGDKKDDAAFCGWLATHGYVVAAVNYRLSPSPKEPGQRRAHYPAQIEDCQNAVRWLRKNAKEYGIDPNRIAAVGRSAGGHLASLLGTKDGEGCRVQAVVSYFGAHDPMPESKENAATVRLMGGTPEDKLALWKDASASTHVTRDDPPFLLVHGDKDRTVPLSVSENFRKNLEAAGVACELIVAQGGTHGGGLGQTTSPAMDEIDKRVLDFLDKHLKQEVRLR